MALCQTCAKDCEACGGGESACRNSMSPIMSMHTLLADTCLGQVTKPITGDCGRDGQGSAGQGSCRGSQTVLRLLDQRVAVPWCLAKGRGCRFNEAWSTPPG